MKVVSQSFYLTLGKDWNERVSLYVKIFLQWYLAKNASILFQISQQLWTLSAAEQNREGLLGQRGTGMKPDSKHLHERGTITLGLLSCYLLSERRGKTEINSVTLQRASFWCAPSQKRGWCLHSGCGRACPPVHSHTSPVETGVHPRGPEKNISKWTPQITNPASQQQIRRGEKQLLSLITTFKS